MVEERVKKTIEYLEEQIALLEADEVNFNLYDEVDIAYNEDLNCYRKILAMLKGS